MGMHRAYLTVNECATALRVNPITVRRWIWSGRLPATQHAGRNGAIRVPAPH